MPLGPGEVQLSQETGWAWAACVSARRQVPAQPFKLRGRWKVAGYSFLLPHKDSKEQKITRRTSTSTFQASSVPPSLREAKYTSECQSQTGPPALRGRAAVEAELRVPFLCQASGLRLASMRRVSFVGLYSVLGIEPGAFTLTYVPSPHSLPHFLPLWIDPPAHPSVHPSVHLSVHPSIHQQGFTVLLGCPGWAGTCDCPTSDSWNDGIRGAHCHIWPRMSF